MSGRWVRRARPGDVHECALPDEANTGDIWQCDGCGRRWRCAESSLHLCEHHAEHASPEMLAAAAAAWRRRRWPWPRLERVDPIDVGLSELLGFDASEDPA